MVLELIILRNLSNDYILNSAYTKSPLTKNMAITRKTLCTKYTRFTYNDITLNEKPPIRKQNLSIFFLVIGGVECIAIWLISVVFSISSTIAHSIWRWNKIFNKKIRFLKQITPFLPQANFISITKATEGLLIIYVCPVLDFIHL